MTDIRALPKPAVKIPGGFLGEALKAFLAPWLAGFASDELNLKAKKMKEECLELLHARVAVEIQLATLALLKSRLGQLNRDLAAMQKDLRKLGQVFTTATQSLPDKWPGFPLEPPENGWDAVFRMPVVDPRLAEWALNRFHPDFRQWLREMIEQDQLLQNWSTLTVEAIHANLAPRALHRYMPFWQISIEEILELWALKKPGFESEEFVSRQWILDGMQAVYPLLRPDFDAAGGSGISNTSYHLLLGGTDWEYCTPPGNGPDSSRWETLYTGDPYCVLFVQARHAVPLNSLTDLIRADKVKYQVLSEEQKQEYAFLSGLA